MRSDIHYPKFVRPADSGSHSDLAERIDREIAELDAGERLDLRLSLAARLCEDGAFGAAGLWSADKIATAVLLAAQIERLLRPDNS